MQNADAECVIEFSFERQLKNVALDYVCIRRVASKSECRFDSVAEIDPDHFLRTPFGGELCMPALSASAFEHDLAFKKFRLNRLQPSEKLFVILWIFLRE